jgi:hypothetical protein
MTKIVSKELRIDELQIDELQIDELPVNSKFARTNF